MHIALIWAVDAHFSESSSGRGFKVRMDIRLFAIGKFRVGDIGLYSLDCDNLAKSPDETATK
jgi:hypothetical protein